MREEARVNKHEIKLPGLTRCIKLSILLAFNAYLIYNSLPLSHWVGKDPPRNHALIIWLIPVQTESQVVCSLVFLGAQVKYYSTVSAMLSKVYTVSTNACALLFASKTILICVMNSKQIILNNYNTTFLSFEIQIISGFEDMLISSNSTLR